MSFSCAVNPDAADAAADGAATEGTTEATNQEATTQEATTQEATTEEATTAGEIIISTNASDLGDILLICNEITT